jgi:thymidylate kinase
VIFALEGPDGSGKSTLLEAVQTNAIKLQSLTMEPELFRVIHLVERRQEQLLRRMYDPAKTYLSDRINCISGRVYSRVANRPCFLEPWPEQVIPIYLRLPLEELVRRYTERGDIHVTVDQLADMQREYDVELAHYDCITLDGMQPVSELAAEVARIVKDLR